MNANSSIKETRWLTGVLVLLFVLSVGWLNYGNYMAAEPLWAMVVNTFLLAIPTGLLFFSIWVLLLAWQQRRRQGGISGRPAALIYWTPRIAGILITLFVTLFSFDVFEGDASIWEKLGGFLIHSTPAIGLAVAVAIAWRRDWLGFWMFTLAAVAFLAITFQGILQNPLMEIGVLLLFAAPMAVIAAMYWVNWKWKPLV